MALPRAIVFGAFVAPLPLCVQAPPAGEEPPAKSEAQVAVKGGTGPLAAFAWLAGCWRGEVNQREFREHWMPLRGGLLIGTSHTVNAGESQDFDYLRLERRPDGVYYVTMPQGKSPVVFKYEGASGDEGDSAFVFAASGDGFPKRIVYRRGEEGWLYVHVEGVLNGAERKVIYPMRRIGCESGELIRR